MMKQIKGAATRPKTPWHLVSPEDWPETVVV